MNKNNIFILGVLLGCSVVSGCAIQRAQVAHDARSKLIGMSKEEILACMGAPNRKAAEGATEVWSYASGDGRTTVVGSGTSHTDVSVSGNQNSASGTASTAQTSFLTSRQRYCTVNIAMTDGHVSRVNYIGPTGDLLTAGEQCAFAVQNCVVQ